MRSTRLPPFFTHGIGSLPRPKVVRDLFARRHEMYADRFQRTLDDCVVFAIRLQEEVGLDDVADGEWRCAPYILARAGAALIGPERIALNPDCGFAPDVGEPPTIDKAYEKTRNLVEAANQLRTTYQS